MPSSASAPEIACVSEGIDEAASALVERLDDFLSVARMPRSLRDCGVKESTLRELASEAAKQWTATFNPVAISEGDFLALYQAAF
jgi:alcohol dehydrogenase